MALGAALSGPRAGRLGLVLALLALAGCHPPGTQETTLEREEIERRAQVRLPPGARDVHVHTETGIDSMVMLRFAIDAGELGAFLASAGFTEPLREELRPFTPSDSEGLAWWHPERATRARGGHRADEDRASEVMVDLTDPEHPVVYLKTFTL
ncbi:MAG TPA: hypothetical protein VF263_23125 [Longimicrobiaceae bacterium]